MRFKAQHVLYQMYCMYSQPSKIAELGVYQKGEGAAYFSPLLLPLSFVWVGLRVKRSLMNTAFDNILDHNIPKQTSPLYSCLLEQRAYADVHFEFKMAKSDQEKDCQMVNCLAGHILATKYQIYIQLVYSYNCLEKYFVSFSSPFQSLIFFKLCFDSLYTQGETRLAATMQRFDVILSFSAHDVLEKVDNQNKNILSKKKMGVCKYLVNQCCCQ